MVLSRAVEIKIYLADASRILSLLPPPLMVLCRMYRNIATDRNGKPRDLYCQVGGAFIGIRSLEITLVGR